MKKIALTSLIIVFSSTPLFALAQSVMSSATYKLESDSLNSGGVLSNSASYGLEDTAGETATGRSQSSNFGMFEAGYQGMRTNIAAPTGGAPTTPTNLVATVQSSSVVDLTWDASTDDQFVVGYYVYRGGVRIAQTSDFPREYQDTGLSAGTQYSYQVSAFDNDGNESAKSAAVVVTTLGAVASSNPGGYPVMVNFQIIPDANSAVVTFVTQTPITVQAAWGLNTQYAAGATGEGSPSLTHKIILTNLTANTNYVVRLALTDALGSHMVFENIPFLTLKTPVITTPPNAAELRAVAHDQDITLTWQNPIDPRVSSVQLVRSKTFYPANPTDGEVIFEGVGSQFIDTSAQAGTTYYYTLFTKDLAGNYSSGSIVSARILLPGETTGPNPLDVLESASHVDPMIAALKLSDFLFIQDGDSLKIPADTVQIDGSKNTTVALTYYRLPQILKTVAVTLVTEGPNPESFSFILKANASRTRYEATIGPLGPTRDYKLAIAVIDYQNQGLKRIDGMLRVLAHRPALVGSTYTVPASKESVSFFAIVLTLMLLIFALALKRFRTLAPAMVALLLFLIPFSSHAAVNAEINYQGRLVDTSNVAVPNGSYNMRFNLYTQASGGSSIWTETLTGSDRVPVTSGLFSVMLASTTPFTGVNFNQTLYLGVEIGGTGGSPTWDGEMTPRKIIGAVPAALTADKLDNLDSTQFLRSDVDSTFGANLTVSGTLTSGAINGQTISSSASFTGTVTATGGLTTLSNLLLNGSSTLQNLTFVNATGTNATTTNFFATTASTTNFFGAGLVTCNSASSALSFSNGRFGCNNSISGTSASSTLLSDNNAFTGLNAFTDLVSVLRSTTTQATSTNLFATTGTFTNFYGANLSTCNNASSALTWSAGMFGCNTITGSGGSGSDNNWSFFNNSGIRLGTSTNQVLVSSSGATATTSLAKLEVTFDSAANGSLLVTGSSTLQNFTFVNATGTNATTTNLFSTTASSTNLFSTTFTTGNLTANGTINSQTISSAANFTGTVAVTTSLTSPVVIGGSGVGSSLELRSTSGSGSTDFIKLTVGNNGGTEVARFANGGYVGVGTTTPKWLLQLATSTAPQLTLSDAIAANNHWSFRNAGGNLYLATSSPTTFATSSVPALTINTNGNVGIGTSSPFAKLTVQASSGQTNPIFQVASSSNDIQFVNVQNTGNTTFYSDSNLGDDTFTINRNGFTDLRVITSSGGDEIRTAPIFAGNFDSSLSTYYTTVQHSSGISFSAPVNSTISGNDTGGAFAGMVTGCDASINCYTLMSIGEDSGGGALDAGDVVPGIGFAGLTVDDNRGGSTVLGASIIGKVDGTVSSGKLPTSLVFNTSLTSSGGLTERMRITSAGNVGVGTSTPRFLVQLASSTAPQLTLSDAIAADNHWSFRNAGGYLYIATSSPSTFATSTATALTIDPNGRVIASCFSSDGGATCMAASSGASSTLLVDNNAFTGNNTFTNATTTNLFSTTASSTNIFTSSLRADGATLAVLNTTHRVGIGTVSPNFTLDVNGDINFGGSNGIYTGGVAVLVASSSNSSTLVGLQAGNSLPSDGLFNTLVGYQAGFTNGSADYNTALGFSALYNNSASNNTAFGAQAGYNTTTGDKNVFSGFNSGYLNTTGTNNVAVGYQASTNNASATSTVAVGYNAASGPSSFSAQNYTAVGNEALAAIVTGANDNTALGYRAGFAVSSGNKNTLLGNQAGLNLTTGSQNIIIGYNLNANAADSSNTLNIGNALFGTGLSGTGNTVAGNIGIGTSTPPSHLTLATSTTYTKNFPDLLIGPRNLSNSASANGTIIGMNLDNGFSGDLIDLQVNGTSVLNVDPAGVITTGSNGNIISGGNVYSANMFIAGSNVDIIGANGSGILELADHNTGNTFNRLQFGGTTTAYPAIGRSNQALIVELASGANGGYLAVGTSTPQWSLQVASSTRAQLTLSDGSLTSNHWSFRNAGGLFYLATSSPTTFATSTVPALSIDTNGTLQIYNNAVFTASGNTGIGTTTPNWNLQVAGPTPYLALTDSDAASNNKHVIISNLNGILRVGTSSDDLVSTSTAFSLDPSQGSQLGVGTTSPWKTLSVVGTASIDGLTGATGAGSLCLSADKEIVYNAASDACLPSLRATKHDINPLTVTALDQINALQPVSFIYNSGNGRTRYGFIAEDTATVDEHLATYDDKGNISGIDDRALLSVTVKSIQELNQKISQLSSGAAASTTAAIQTALGLDLNNLAAGFDIQNNVTIHAGLKVDHIASISGLTTLDSDTEFVGRPYFNSDTGGLAVIEAGKSEVDVTFDNPYIDAPVVSATLSLDASTTDSDLSQTVMDQPNYFVARRSNTGFAIVLTKPVSKDTTFSWIALAIKNMKVASSASTTQPIWSTSGVTVPPPAPTPSPSPVPDLNSSSTPPITGSSTPPVTGSSTPAISSNASSTPAT